MMMGTEMASTPNASISGCIKMLLKNPMAYLRETGDRSNFVVVGGPSAETRGNETGRRLEVRPY